MICGLLGPSRAFRGVSSTVALGRGGCAGLSRALSPRATSLSFTDTLQADRTRHSSLRRQHLPANFNSLNGSGRIRSRATFLQSSPSSSFNTATQQNGNSLSVEPSFTWPQLVELFRRPTKSHESFIPSDHPNLALFRRSVAAQQRYEKHKAYLDENWLSAYDYLVFSKFGASYGIERVLVNRGGSDRDAVVNQIGDVGCTNQPGKNSIPPEGYIYRASPSLGEASKYTIDNRMAYLKLVLNDFPYDVEDGIEHWCLWKIGGSSITEGILREELTWAMGELQCIRADGNSGSGCIVREGERTILGGMDRGSGSDVQRKPAAPISDALYWVNPPHLQSMPEIHHAHILVVRSGESPMHRPPPV